VPSAKINAVKPFQFMIATRGNLDRARLIDLARTAESVGYSHVCIHDHLTQQLAPIPTLTAVAMATDRMRLCPLVLNNDLRHPAVLAQDLATLDVISEGRVVVGIGAGWNEPEYMATGIPFDAPGVRIERMAEAVVVMRGLFGDGPFSFSGRHYTITTMDGQPKPVQRPYPPFLIGGTRERVLRLAAQTAEIVGLDLRQDRASLPDAFPARMDDRIGWVRDSAGPRFDELDLSVLRVLGEVAITNHAPAAAAELASQLEAQAGCSVTPEEVLESPYTLIGTVPDLVAKLLRARERWGINSYLVGWVGDPGLQDVAPLVEQLAGT
jgi:probable F420-dependent oxidoreductase